MDAETWPATRLATAIDEAARYCFELTTEIPLRICLFRTADDDHVLPVVAVGNNPTKGRRKEDWKLRGKTYRSQQQGRPGQPVHQPRLGDALHPGARVRQGLPAEVDPVAA